MRPWWAGYITVILIVDLGIFVLFAYLDPKAHAPSVTPISFSATAKSVTLPPPEAGWRFIRYSYVDLDSVGAKRRHFVSAALYLNVVNIGTSPLTIQNYWIELRPKNGSHQLLDSVPIESKNVDLYRDVTPEEIASIKANNPDFAYIPNAQRKVTLTDKPFNTAINNQPIGPGDTASGWVFLVLNGPTQPLWDFWLCIQPTDGEEVDEPIALPNPQENRPLSPQLEVTATFPIEDLRQIPVVNQLDIYDVPRTLGNHRAELISAINLPEFRGQKISIGSAPNSECQNFASELLAALKDGGWDATNQSFVVPPGRVGVNLWISAAVINMPIAPSATAFQTFLYKYGYTQDTTQINGYAGIPAAELRLYVYPVLPQLQPAHPNAARNNAVVPRSVIRLRPIA